MKKLLKDKFYQYLLICFVTIVASFFCGKFWSVPITVVGIIYLIYCKKTIRYDAYEEYSMYDGFETYKYPAKGYERQYLAHAVNSIFVIVGVIGLLYLIFKAP